MPTLFQENTDAATLNASLAKKRRKSKTIHFLGWLTISSIYFAAIYGLTFCVQSSAGLRWFLLVIYAIAAPFFAWALFLAISAANFRMRQLDDDFLLATMNDDLSEFSDIDIVVLHEKRRSKMAEGTFDKLRSEIITRGLSNSATLEQEKSLFKARGVLAEDERSTVFLSQSFIAGIPEYLFKVNKSLLYELIRFSQINKVRIRNGRSLASRGVKGTLLDIHYTRKGCPLKLVVWPNVASTWIAEFEEAGVSMEDLRDK